MVKESKYQRIAAIGECWVARREETERERDLRISQEKHNERYKMLNLL
jgi:hypothetical protein